MSRFRTHRTADKGQVYASLWVEFHVDCAADGCDSHLLVAELGYVNDVGAAEKLLRQHETGDDSEGWVCRKKRWYCPKCAKTKGK
jgi:hypothetical protein